MDAQIESKTESKWTTAVKLILAIVIPNIGGMLGAIVSRTSINEWYPTLDKPSWTPPNWLFMPVWVLLYSLIGSSSYLVHRLGKEKPGLVKWSVIIYRVNLILNWCWMPIFFWAKTTLGGLLIIISVLITSVPLAISFSLVKWLAGVLILPYIAWLAMGAYLNWWIYVNN